MIKFYSIPVVDKLQIKRSINNHTGSIFCKMDSFSKKMKNFKCIKCINFFNKHLILILI
jgi:hypothetical protein